DMVGKVLSAKLANPVLAWRIPGVLWAKIYGMQTASGSYIFRDEMKNGVLCGYPFKIDNNITVGDDANGKTQIFFGDWQHFLIGVESALQISISNDASYTDGEKSVSAFENDLTLMRGILREDFGVRYTEAFVWADGIFTKASA
ncbi:MAG: phage major capsid protein, partial [Phascolarctobacterium sp.]